MKIYDCFQFFNELDLLEVRLNLLYDHVDHFVITESNKTHSNNPKPLYFEKNKHLFSQYLDKITVISEDFPEEIFKPTQRHNGNAPYDTQYNNSMGLFMDEYTANVNGLRNHETFARDWLQREYIKLGLTHCNDDDIIMISDLDEFPNPRVVEDMKSQTHHNCVAMMDCHNFYINNLCHTNWYGTVFVKYKDMHSVSLTHFRSACKGELFTKIWDAGWHLSFVGGTSRIKEKIEGYSHQEFNTPGVLSSIENKIKLNQDLFGRTNATYRDEIQEYFFDKMKEVDLDNYSYPQTLVDLVKNKFPYLIKE